MATQGNCTHQCVTYSLFLFTLVYENLLRPREVSRQGCRPENTYQRGKYDFTDGLQFDMIGFSSFAANNKKTYFVAWQLGRSAILKTYFSYVRKQRFTYFYNTGYTFALTPTWVYKILHNMQVNSNWKISIRCKQNCLLNHTAVHLVYLRCSCGSHRGFSGKLKKQYLSICQLLNSFGFFFSSKVLCYSLSESIGAYSQSPS